MVKTKLFFLTACLRIKKSYPLDVTTVSGATAITNYDVIEWTPLGAAASQTN
jgi:hypothetical protein